MEPAGVQREDAEAAADLRCHVDEDDVLGAAERDREIGRVLADRQRDDVARIAACVLGGCRRNGLGIERHGFSRGEDCRVCGELPYVQARDSIGNPLGYVSSSASRSAIASS
jgi:hypothetical protein